MGIEHYMPSPNVSAPSRKNDCVGVVWHHSGGSYAGGVDWICDPKSKVSYHVLFSKAGERTVFAPDNRVCWHAGRSRWRGKEFCNGFTLGASFEGDTYSYELTTAQIQSAIEWLTPRAKKYGWKMRDMTTHREVSPRRKNDISPAAETRLFSALITIL